MVEIKCSSKELRKEEAYIMTASNQGTSMKDVPDNAEIQVNIWAFVERTNEDTGEELELLSIFDGQNVYVTQSKTFLKSFKEISTIMGEEGYKIRKISGTTRSGREYIDCQLVIENM